MRKPLREVCKIKQKDNNQNCRLGTVGGQAVIEGVMMKASDRYSIALRMPDEGIRVSNHTFQSLRKKAKFFNIPIIRGVVNFIDMMKLSFQTLSVSADALGLDEIEEESKFEKWLSRRFGKSIIDVIMAIATVLGVALGVGLFMLLPMAATKGIDDAAGGLGWFRNLLSGLIRIVIFVLYLWLVSFMKDIRRTFEYHGAEHKSVFCYEAGEELTPENVKKHSRFHPRCGTSFIFVMLIISILFFSLPIFRWDNIWLRFATTLPCMPLIIGIGYEFIMYAGKHDNLLIRILSTPGLWMQRITTREPDEKQIEVAIAALKSALPDVFPEEAAALAEASKRYEKDDPAAETLSEPDNDAASAAPQMQTPPETVADAPAAPEEARASHPVREDGADVPGQTAGENAEESLD